MKPSFHNNRRVLAIDPYDQGFGFALFEGSDELIDWGLKHACNHKTVRLTTLLAKLIERYDPDMLIIEDGSHQGSSRRRETRLLLKRIRRYAKQRRLQTHVYSRAQVEDAFSSFGVRNKHQIATAIAGWFPELAPRLPGPQKSWTGENRSMNVFDAVSFALTYFHFENIQPLTARRSPQPSLSACGGSAGSVSLGNDQVEEDAGRLSSSTPAAPAFRPDKLPPQFFM